MNGWTLVSGGQTGVDRAALDVARELGLTHGGYVPKGRWTEDGELPADYEGMVETEARHPAARTKRNVENADATLLISRGPCEGGTWLTLNTAQRRGKPHLHIDLATMDRDAAARRVKAWLSELPPGTLNVAGPRASKDPGVYADAKAILRAVFGAASD